MEKESFRHPLPDNSAYRKKALEFINKFGLELRDFESASVFHFATPAGLTCVEVEFRKFGCKPLRVVMPYEDDKFIEGAFKFETY